MGENMDMQQVIAQAITLANEQLHISKSDGGVKTRNMRDSEPQQQPLAEASTQLPENLETLITVVTTAVMTAISASLPNLVNAAQNANCEKKMEVMQDKFQEKILDAKYDNDKIEQYGRRESIRIFGVPEDRSEKNDISVTRQKVIDTLKKIDVTVTHDNISAGHRIGKMGSGRVRPIICKFVSRQHRDLVMNNKHKIKGTEIFINEDLTYLRNRLLTYVKKNVPNVTPKSVHSVNGRITCKFSTDSDNKWHHFESPKDLLKSEFGPDSVDYGELGLSDNIMDFSTA